MVGRRTAWLVVAMTVGVLAAGTGIVAAVDHPHEQSSGRPATFAAADLSTGDTVPEVDPVTTTTMSTTTTTTTVRPTTTQPPVTKPPVTAPPSTAATTTTTTPRSGGGGDRSGMSPLPFQTDPVTGGPLITQPYAPGRWHLSYDRVTIDLKMEPTAPQRGDVVTFTYTATGDGEYCCDLSFYIGSETTPLADTHLDGFITCPLPKTSTGTATYKAQFSGNFEFHVSAMLGAVLCTGLPQIWSVNLFGGFVVGP